MPVMPAREATYPAFPQPLCERSTGEIVCSEEYGVGGLTIRDYFAAHASEADIAHYTHAHRDGDAAPRRIRTRCQSRFAHAAAMLYARSEPTLTQEPETP